jgi:hypothetical protein
MGTCPRARRTRRVGVLHLPSRPPPNTLDATVHEFFGSVPQRYLVPEKYIARVPGRRLVASERPARGAIFSVEQVLLEHEHSTGHRSWYLVGDTAPSGTAYAGDIQVSLGAFRDVVSAAMTGSDDRTLY